MQRIPPLLPTPGALRRFSPGFPVRAVSLFLFLWAGWLQAEPLFEAKVYRQDTSELLFYQQNRVEKNGDALRIIHEYSTPDSTLAVRDEATVMGRKLISASTTFFQVTESGTLRRDGDTLEMTFQQDGHLGQKSFTFPQDILVGPLFTTFIIDHWQALENGEKLHVTLPAPRVMRLATFTIARDASSESPGFMVIKLSVSSIFLKLFVGSSRFTFDVATRRLREIHGATILKTKHKDKWRDTTDASIFYKYLDEAEPNE